MNEKKHTYIITRKVVETYEVEAESKEQALHLIGDRGNPGSITVTSETVKKKFYGLKPIEKC